eukprot:Phypoly_transcript_10301.p1 GENE.Phypoly_transcript_10301~~Phypoly_transcript_10301.p1  ORF type:complete len:123 (+),score=3.21 Phypoly_transcript_10301:213-581(+)
MNNDTEKILAPPSYGELWPLQIMYGVATFDAPVFTTGYLWRLKMGSSIPDLLVVLRDRMYGLGSLKSMDVTKTPTEDPHVMNDVWPESQFVGGKFVGHWSWLPSKHIPFQNMRCLFPKHVQT